MNSILVPTDFSNIAGYASDLAADLALKVGADLNFIHVLDIPQSGGSEYYLNYQVVKQLSHEAEDKLKILQKRYGPKIHTNTFVITSPPIESISNAVNSINPDLVIMGTGGNKDLENILLGSNTERVVRNTRCPVLTIHEPVKLSDFKKTVVAFDPETFSESLAWEIKGLQTLFDTELTFAYVKSFDRAYTEEELTFFLETYISRIDIDYNLEIIESSFIEDSIVEYGKVAGANLIVLNTHSRKGFSRFINGSIAENIISMSKIPTMVFHLQKNDQHYLYETA